MRRFNKKIDKKNSVNSFWVTKIFKNLVFIFMSRRRRKFLKIIYSKDGGAAGSLDHWRRRLRNLENFSPIGGGTAARLTPLTVIRMYIDLFMIIKRTICHFLLIREYFHSERFIAFQCFTLLQTSLFYLRCIWFFPKRFFILIVRPESEIENCSFLF